MAKLTVYLSENNQLDHGLAEETVTVGRVADNSIQVSDDSVSSHHAELVMSGNTAQLKDLGSTNGTFVNGQQITEATLKDGDRVRFGQIEAIFKADRPSGDAQPLPEAGKSGVSLGGASARPASFVNASPFPKPKEKTDALTYAAVILAVIGALGFFGSVIMTMQVTSPL